MCRFIVLIAFGCFASLLDGQAPESRALEFEVASVKADPSLPIGQIGPGFKDGRINAIKVKLLDLLAFAYDVTAPRVVGPGWLDGDRFDVIAKAPDQSSKDDARQMLQTLLKERFHLVAHMETRTMSSYDLVVAKGGVKMIRPGDPNSPIPKSAYSAGKNISRGGGTLTMSQMAEMLCRAAGKPVVDKTGLDGKYAFSLAYTMDVLQEEAGAPDLGPPDLFTAVQNQLGLRLQPSKGDFTVVVVDAMDRMPTDN